MRKLSKRGVLAASFLLPCAVMAGVFAVCGLAPFGARTLGVMDMAHQYLPFLYSLRDILAGRADLLYLPSMCLGGDMLGVAAYYLASPLDLLTCLFPREGMYDAVGLLYLLRVGLCGLTMCVYTGRRRGYGPRCLVPAMAYAFTAYMVGYCFNYLWQDCVILLPLVALGLSRLTEGGRPWLYIVSLAGALWCNFYIGYILCIFSVLFFLCELFSAPRAERVRPARAAGVFALSSLAAGALSAVLLLPAFLSLSGGKAEFSLSNLTLALNFSPAELLSKLYPGAFAYEQIMPEGLPQIFCGTVTTALTVLYFTDKRIPRRRRVLTGALMAVIAVSFWVSALDLVWHAFNTPSWYNHRYSFVLGFLMAAAADCELSVRRDGARPGRFLLPVALCAAASAYVFLGRRYDYVSWPSALAALGVTALTCGAAYLLARPGTKRPAALALCALLLAVHAGELAVNAKLSLDALTGVASDSAAFARYAADKAAAFALIDTDGAFVRTESPDSFDQDRCEPMLFGYDGLSHYGSTLSQRSLDFLDRLGLDRYTDLWAAYGGGVTAAADSFLGVRYVVGQSLQKDYEPVGAAGGYTVWENPDALDIGFTAGAAFAEPVPDTDCFTYINALYAAAAPEVGREVFAPAGVESVLTENYSTADGIRYTRGEDGPASLTYTVTTARSGPLYAELEIPDFPGVMVYVDDVFSAWYATAQTNGSLFLGRYDAGQTVRVKLSVPSDLTVERAAFATEDAQALSLYHDALSAGGCALTKRSASRYEGSFSVPDADTLLVLTLPYDEAWTVLVDGQRAQTVRVQDCLMAVSVAPGGHTLALYYTPAGLVPGAVISAAALVCCAAVFVVTTRKKTRRP